jgi:hypothetical protein
MSSSAYGSISDVFFSSLDGFFDCVMYVTGVSCLLSEDGDRVSIVLRDHEPLMFNGVDILPVLTNAFYSVYLGEGGDFTCLNEFPGLIEWLHKNYNGSITPVIEADDLPF